MNVAAPASAPQVAPARGRPRGERLRVGLAQVESGLGALEANVKRHLAVIERAHAEELDCLVFPEMSLTGHSAGIWTLDISLDRQHPHVTRLANAAGAMRVTFGLIEEGAAAQFYNAAYTVSNGEIVHIHRKVNLATYGSLEDGKYFAEGRYIETFSLGRRWRAATLVCNDFWNPGLVYLAALHGATLLLVPVSSAKEAVGGEFDNPSSWDCACRYTAMVYGMPVVFVNRIGREQGLTFWGGSRMVDAYGRVVAEAGADDELLVAELDYDDVRRARTLLPTVRDSNLDLVVREIQRLQGSLGVPDQVRRD